MTFSTLASPLFATATTLYFSDMARVFCVDNNNGLDCKQAAQTLTSTAFIVGASLPVVAQLSTKNWKVNPTVSCAVIGGGLLTSSVLAFKILKENYCLVNGGVFSECVNNNLYYGRIFLAGAVMSVALSGVAEIAKKTLERVTPIIKFPALGALAGLGYSKYLESQCRECLGLQPVSSIEMMATGAIVATGVSLVSNMLNNCCKVTLTEEEKAENLKIDE